MPILLRALLAAASVLALTVASTTLPSTSPDEGSGSSPTRGAAVGGPTAADELAAFLRPVPSDRRAPAGGRPGETSVPRDPAAGSETGPDAPHEGHDVEDGRPTGTGRRDHDPVADERPLGTLDPDTDVPPHDPRPGDLRAASGGHRAPPPSGPGHGGPKDLKAGPGCSVQCITSGVAYARGVGARLVVETDTPAEHWIIVWNDDTGYHDLRHSSQLGTSYGQLFADLEPGTTYQAMAAAQDAAGHTSHAYGSFTTLRREAEVNFHLNWSVTGTPYDTRFHYHYRVDHLWRGHLSVTWPEPQPPTNLPQPVTVADADRYLDLAVQVVAEGEKQSGFGKGGCPVEPTDTPFGPFPETGGTDTYGCTPYAWATAQRSCLVGIDLDARPADATSWTSHTLRPTISTSDGCDGSAQLSFAPSATVEVRYVP